MAKLFLDVVGKIELAQSSPRGLFLYKEKQFFSFWLLLCAAEGMLPWDDELCQG